MEFTHQATAYILRWNKKDYKEIIGVFLTKEHLASFTAAHFTQHECMALLLDLPESDLKVETGRHYVPKWR